jgi:hypothetical protein
VDGGHHATVECRIELAPLARRHDRPGGEAQGLEHHADADGIGREHLTEQRHGRLRRPPATRRLDGAGEGLFPGIVEHGASQDVLGLGVGRHAEARHVDGDDSDPVDLFRDLLDRHARSGRHAEVGDDDGIVVLGIGELDDSLTDVLVELAGDQRLGIERHVADGPPRPIEVGGEGQAVDAAGGARQHGGRALHPEADAQGPEGGTHALRLVVRADGVVGGIALESLALAGRHGRRLHLLGTGVAAGAVAGGGRRRRRLGRRLATLVLRGDAGNVVVRGGIELGGGGAFGKGVGHRAHVLMRRRRRLRGTASRRSRDRTCRPWWPAAAPRRDPRPRS